MNQPSKDDENGFNDLIREALLSSARLRHCAATDCRCGQGRFGVCRRTEKYARKLKRTERIRKHEHHKSNTKRNGRSRRRG